LKQEQAFDLLTLILEQTKLEEVIVIRDKKNKGGDDYSLRVDAIVESDDMMNLAKLCLKEDRVFGVYSDGVLIE
jgi:hypothetical protein